MPHSLYGEKQQTAPAAVCATPFNSSASTPPPARMASLLAHQQRLTADLQRADSRGGSVPAMQKISKDPAWADLWNAFACAFVSCCDAQGCGGFVCSDLGRRHLEGAILRPDYSSCSPRMHGSTR
jgi:hypothetical protein